LLAALVDQLVVALRQAPGKIPLGQKGDCVAIAAWLVQLAARSQHAPQCNQKNDCEHCHSTLPDHATTWSSVGVFFVGVAAGSSLR
jgi:hypothetical protein